MNIDEKVKDIISEQLGIPKEEIKLESSLIEDLAADSLDTVEIVMCLEEEFGIEIPDEDAEKLITVREVIEHVEEKGKKEANVVTLGDKVKDIVSSFDGIAVSRHSYLNGCDRITVQPPVDKKNKLPDSRTFDEPQLKIIKKGKVKIKIKIPGGTDKYMDEGR